LKFSAYVFMFNHGVTRFHKQIKIWFLIRTTVWTHY